MRPLKGDSGDRPIQGSLGGHRTRLLFDIEKVRRGSGKKGLIKTMGDRRVGEGGEGGGGKAGKEGGMGMEAEGDGGGSGGGAYGGPGVVMVERCGGNRVGVEGGMGGAEGGKRGECEGEGVGGRGGGREGGGDSFTRYCGVKPVLGKWGKGRRGWAEMSLREGKHKVPTPVQKHSDSSQTERPHVEEESC